MLTHTPHQLVTARTAFVTGGSGFVGLRLIARLARDGWKVRALARSPEAEAAVAEAGAEPVRGDLDDEGAPLTGMDGAGAVFHAAALFKLWGPRRDFERANVDGTRRLLVAATAARSVTRFVQIGASGVVMRGRESLRGVDETAPTVEPPYAPYIASKARSERLVLAANDAGGLVTCVVRPPLIWGAGMPMLDGIARDVAAGRFAWPGGAKQLMSTAHADNVAHAAVLAAERGRGGEAYFVADGEDRSLREVITALLATREVVPGERAAPLGLAWPMAAAMEVAWRVLPLPGEPPITRQMLRMVGYEFTLDITKARRELGYTPVINWDEGLAEMRSAATPGRALRRDGSRAKAAPAAI